jgi:signal transduction histidine kinase
MPNVRFSPNKSVLIWFVIGYLTLAFVWWSRLLFIKNEESFKANIEVLKSKNLQFPESAEYKLLKEKHQRQHWMIVGEGCTFILLLFVGLRMIQKSHRRELKIVNQQNNFLLSITHELKSPLTGIRLIFDTLLSRNLEKNQLEKVAQNGLKDTNRLQQLVEDLLLAARLEDKWQPNLRVVDLSKLASEVAAGLKIRYPEAKFLFFLQEEPMFLEADETAMTAVFQNLLENAVKYSPENPEIIIRFFEVDDKFGFAIEDFGAGIADAEKSRIFEKFYRVGDEKTRQTKGTGLGLFIVKKVVELHNGRIFVHDNEPKGSIFTVIFFRKK